MIAIGADDLHPGTAVKAVEAKKRALLAALHAIGIESGQVTLSTLQRALLHREFIRPGCVCG